MRIFILDDDDRRHNRFASYFLNDERTHVRRYWDALRELQTQPQFDRAYLDHDLADFGDFDTEDGGMEGPIEFTGSDVAKFIARELPEEKRPKHIIVHSLNPVGTLTMVDILRRAGCSVAAEPYNGGSETGRRFYDD